MSAKLRQEGRLLDRQILGNFISHKFTLTA